MLEGSSNPKYVKFNSENNITDTQTATVRMTPAVNTLSVVI